MLLLDHTDVSLQAVLDAAPATTQPTFVASYVNLGGTFGGGNFDGSLSGATPVNLIEPPGSGVRRGVRTVCVHNVDTAECVVTFRFKRGASVRRLFRAQLPVGAWAKYGAGSGFGVFAGGRELRVVRGPLARDHFAFYHVDNTAGIRSNYIAGMVASAAVSTIGLTANNYYAKPFIAPHRAAPVLSRIGVYVTTGVALSTLRLAVYDARDASGKYGSAMSDCYPGSLLFDSGDLASATNNTAVTATPNLTLIPGRLYWAAATSSSNPTLRAQPAGDNAPGFGAVDAISGSGVQNGFYGPPTGGAFATYGALASIFPPVLLSVSTPNAFFLQYSA